ncbi:MAG: acyl-CoA/acyl-ACP dehydrogenase [Candidatus Rokubacteria bacterium]|nr:acyl-CoA/acyl-ACP dehydrogenase [Candidatus Rokubacteria bacterium]MBI3826303.1 acyl-CoA/acyl-ACP dehydrogenase [Candidatus Rokubacteria bacterium]
MLSWLAVFPLPPLTDEQRSIVDRAARLARERFAPRAARYDAEASFPHENYADLRREGLLALTVPKAYGGVGADPVAYVHALREIARGCSATALTFNMHSVVTQFVDALGTEAQRQRFFADVVERGALVASITSEPEQSFRDRFVLNTVFRPVGDGYHVAGIKQFCSLGDAADYYFVTGVVEGTTSAKEGVISALIPRGDSGVKIEALWDATGMRGTISHTIRYDSTVDADHVIGRPGQYMTLNLQGFALGYAAVYLGIGEAAFEFMVEQAKTKTQRPSTTPVSHHPLVQRTVAEVGTAIRAARLLLHEAATLCIDGDREATMLAVNQAKAYCSDVGLDATVKALRLAGGRGILKEMPLERWHRDALAGPVMPPANDRCLETAGKLICGLRAATLEFQ